MAVTAATLQAAADDRTATDDHIDQVTRDLTAAWATSWTAQDTQLASVLAGLVAAAGAWPTRRAITASFQLQIALAVLQQSLARLAGRAAIAVGAAAHAAATTTGTAQAEMIATQLPPGVNLTRDAAAVPDNQLAELARRAEQSATETLQAVPAQVTDAIRADIIRGHRSNDPRRAIEQTLAGAQKHSSAALAKALLVARTEIMDAHRAAAQAIQDSAAGLLRGWMWMSRLTTDTCPACWAMHGTVHPLSEPGPLDHPAGRCQRIPVLKSWADLGVSGFEPPDASQDAEQVFLALPPADQLRIMGPGRRYLLGTGQITWDDLARRRENPGWRPSYATVPIRDLAR